jgi:basic membrane lipoprotein Med (substrate-binding protein (PBP1-ABC) superfamily)
MFTCSKVPSIVVLFLLVATMLSACQPAATPAPTAKPAAPAATAVPIAAAPTAAPAATKPAATAAAKPLKIAFVFPGLVNEGAFNQLAYAGLQRAKQELGAETDYVESINVPDAPKILHDYASTGYDVVVAWSGAFPAAVQQVAPDFPKTSFVTLSDPGDYPKNAWLVGTDFEDAYYLSGAFAAYMTKSNKISHVLGVPIPIYSAGALAYEAGAKSVNPRIEVYQTFIGDFNDAVKAKQTTAAQMEQGADIVQCGLDQGKVGMIEATKTNKDIKIILNMIGPDANVAPGQYIGGLTQDYPTALITVFKQIQAGKLGDYYLNNDLVPADVIAKLDALKVKLINGEIKYPTPADLPKQ